MELGYMKKIADFPLVKTFQNYPMGDILFSIFNMRFLLSAPVLP